MMQLLGFLASLGQPGRDLAYRIDLARELGPRYALRRLLEERAGGTAPSGSGYRRIWAEAAQELGVELTVLGSGFFEFRKDVADDAPLLDRIIGLTGRDPKW